MVWAQRGSQTIDEEVVVCTFGKRDILEGVNGDDAGVPTLVEEASYDLAICFAILN
jgi:hypothetical protein